MRQCFVGLALVSVVLTVPVRGATQSPSREIAGRAVRQPQATAPTNGVTTHVGQERVRETFAADAVGGVGTGRTGPVTITITRWSTAEEREQIALELVGDRSDRLAETFARQAETGFVQIPGRPGYRLRYAWEFRQGGRRRILLATDERVRFRQARDGTRVPNFAISVVELRVDESGDGEGTLDVVTRLEFDAQNRLVGIDAVAPLAVRLLTVTRIE